ncbi:hypothetical protein LXL04_012418 [Taraxacum kok-saghyz]
MTVQRSCDRSTLFSDLTENSTSPASLATATTTASGEGVVGDSFGEDPKYRNNNDMGNDHARISKLVQFFRKPHTKLGLKLPLLGWSSFFGPLFLSHDQLLLHLTLHCQKPLLESPTPLVWTLP